jgi:hypothetical protein
MSNVTKTVPAPAARRSGLRRPLLIAAAVVALLVLVYAGYTMWRMSYVPADLDFSTTQLSENGLYRATIVPDTDPIAINQLHSWVLHVETSDGQSLGDATVSVDGDMPQHGHGMPTQPQVTQNLGNGDYLVEGMRFQMGGWWVVDFVIDANGQQDKVSFNLMLEG